MVGRIFVNRPHLYCSLLKVSSIGCTLNIFLSFVTFPGEKNEEGRRGGEVWYTLWCFPQKDGEED